MATLLKQRSTYWVCTGGTSAESAGDYRCWWNIYYEQTANDKSLNRTKVIVEYVLQTYKSISWESTNSVVYINGSSLGSVSIASSFINGTGNNWTVLATKSKYINHNSDGTASFTFRGTGFGRATAVATYTLPKINRATKIENNSATNNYINFGSELTFTLTKPSTSDTNDIYYQIGSTVYSIAKGTTDTTIKYSFPTTLVDNYPNNKEISLTIYCKNLVSGVISETIVYLKVPDTYKPTVSLTLTEQNSICNNWGMFIKSKSSVKGVVSATAKGNSSIVGYSTTIDNSVYSTNQFTSTVLNPVVPSGANYVDINAVSNVTDSRGLSASTTKTLRVYNYFAPTFVKAELKRCNSDGTLYNRGNYAKVVCNYKIASCNNKNAKSLKVTYGSTTKTFTLSSYEGTITATTSQLFSSFDVGKSYNFTFVLTDSFGETRMTVVLKNSYITRSFKPGGKGIAFGDKATKDGFHSYMDSEFHASLKKNGSNIPSILEVYPVGSIYLSVNSTSPSTLFGGTWERIAQGRCLMGEGVVQANSDNWCGTTNAGDWTAYAGLTGGEVKHSLSLAEIPNHRHPQTAISADGGWAYRVRNSTNINGKGVNSPAVKSAGLYSNHQTSWQSTAQQILFTQGHYGSANGWNMNPDGGAVRHNNMPPYLVVYMWKRTA